jgi:serine/threonine-protein kinase
MIQRFLREGRIANSVGHDGVVSVLDDDIAEDGSAFLVMELLEGEALNDYAAKTHNRLSVDVVLSVIDQVLDALAAAHDKDIIHRDIKPANVFLMPDGRVKLLDFGIAHLDDPSQSLPSVTQGGLAMGTPAFMSPEQACARWDLVGPASDLWSVGATMFTLLTGELVHEKASFHEMLVSAITTPARSLAEVLPGAPVHVVQIVDRALERKLADRWQDAREMQTAVRAAFRAITGEELPVRSPPPVSTSRIRLRAQPPPPVRWRRMAAMALAGLGFVVAATMTTTGWGGARASQRVTASVVAPRPALAETASKSTTPIVPIAVTVAQSPTTLILASPQRSSRRIAAVTPPAQPAQSARSPQSPAPELTTKALFDRRH